MSEPTQRPVDTPQAWFHYADGDLRLAETALQSEDPAYYSPTTPGAPLEKDPRLHTHHITPDLLSYIADKIARAVNPQKIILFGSRARDDATEDSDIDLFVVYDGERSVRDTRREIDLLLWGRSFGVDLIVRTPEQVRLNLEDNNPFYIYHIFGYGKVLYERDQQIAS